MLRISFNSLFYYAALVFWIGNTWSVLGQTSIGIGQWRVHFPFASTHSVVEADQRIFCASPVSLYYFDKADGELNTISKKDGLSGVEITKLGSYRSKELLIGYSDGNIDFWLPDRIQQFNDIQRSSIDGSKAIRHFFIQGNQAFVATDYGLSIINMSRREVSDSYINISNDGSPNPFYASVLSRDGDSIFVASQKGVMGARFSPGVNLKDVNNWTFYGAPEGLPVGATKAVGRLNNVIYAGVDDHGLYYFNGTTWQATSITGTSGFELRSMVSGNNSMILAADNKIYKLFSATSHTVFSGGSLSYPNDAFMDATGQLWISDRTHGLIQFVDGTTNFKHPSGPYTSNVYRLKYINQLIIACPGGLNSFLGSLFIDGGIMFYTPQKNEWMNYNRFDYFPDTHDVIDFTYQASRGKWYFSTFGYGLVEYDGSNFKVYNTGNSSLGSDQVTGLATESNGTVWVGNTSMSTNAPFLYSINANGVWRAYIPNQNVGKFPKDIVIDLSSRKWIRLATSGGNRGLMVFDDKTNSQIYFSTDGNAGALPNNNVNAIEIDKNGQVWIGTDEGIGIFTNPSLIRPGSIIPNVYLPIVDGFPLFFDKKINCIKTDGGNRKWVGTPDGAFLLSEDGLQTVLRFDTDNSPLPNNNIITITIDEQSGEVFFGTDKGIVSFRGDATTGTEVHEQVNVFPNPVLPNYGGFVGISGLANDARVKITDTSGKLVYETRANGASAVWNLNSYSGRRAAAGVYLIFSASEDGAEKFVGKIAILE